MSDEPVKQNDPVRLTSDRQEDQWLACLQAAARLPEDQWLACLQAAARLPIRAQSVTTSAVMTADELYRELRKRCVR